MEISPLLERVRSQKPLVHHITNWVTIFDCAQIVKSFGASPVMAHAAQEAADMARIASSLVLNIGTLTDDIIYSMIIAGRAANEKGIPIVLDVCGAGATKYRDEMCAKLLKNLKISIIKGNASEISRVTGKDVQTKGVDSGDLNSTINEYADIAETLSSQRDCVSIITGKDDIVTNGKQTFIISNGHSLMTHVVGTGCMAASVLGTFAAIESDFVQSSVAALCCYEIAAEEAAQISVGPTDFKNNLCDCVYRLDGKNVDAGKKIIELL